MRAKAIIIVVFAVSLVSLAGKVQAKRDKKEQVDRLALAGVLLRDGHADRAAGVLAEIDPSKKGLNLVRYHTLSGIVALKRQDYRQAIKELQVAVSLGKTDVEVYLLLAQARFALKDWRGALRALARMGAARRRWAGAYVMAAQCYWRLGDKRGSWHELEAGLRYHPDDIELARNKVMLLVDLGLFQQVVAEGRDLLVRAHAQADDFVAIAEALRRAGQHGRAVLLLEEAHLRFPDDSHVLAQLARAYLDDGKPLAAAGMLHRASEVDGRYRYEAAELYRRAGRRLLALHLNAQVDNQKVKVRQRMGLLIELERFEQAAALQPRLSRLGLLEEQKLVYALAYAYFKNGQFASAERWLGHIDQPGLFDKALELRKAMAACEQMGWMCN